jgi:hypothetical protein
MLFIEVDVWITTEQIPFDILVLTEFYQQTQFQETVTSYAFTLIYQRIIRSTQLWTEFFFNVLK